MKRLISLRLIAVSSITLGALPQVVNAQESVLEIPDSAISNSFAVREFETRPVPVDQQPISRALAARLRQMRTDLLTPEEATGTKRLTIGELTSRLETLGPILQADLLDALPADIRAAVTATPAVRTVKRYILRPTYISTANATVESLALNHNSTDIFSNDLKKRDNWTRTRVIKSGYRRTNINATNVTTSGYNFGTDIQLNKQYSNRAFRTIVAKLDYSRSLGSSSTISPALEFNLRLGAPDWVVRKDAAGNAVNAPVDAHGNGGAGSGATPIPPEQVMDPQDNFLSRSLLVPSFAYRIVNRLGNTRRTGLVPAITYIYSASPQYQVGTGYTFRNHMDGQNNYEAFVSYKYSSNLSARAVIGKKGTYALSLSFTR